MGMCCPGPWHGRLTPYHPGLAFCVRQRPKGMAPLNLRGTRLDDCPRCAQTPHSHQNGLKATPGSKSETTAKAPYPVPVTPGGGLSCVAHPYQIFHVPDK
jgi:hypothetical protein